MTASQTSAGEKVVGCSTKMGCLLLSAIASMAGFPLTIPIWLVFFAWVFLTRNQDKNNAIHVAQQIRCTTCKQLIGEQAAVEGYQEREFLIKDLAAARQLPSEVADATASAPWAITCSNCGTRYTLNMDGYPVPTMTNWQAWQDEDGILFAPHDRIAEFTSSGQLQQTATLLHEFVARTGEEAMARHHGLMKWEPYKPTGDPMPCPNACGADYYPDGYGDCPNCGHIG